MTLRAKRRAEFPRRSLTCAEVRTLIRSALPQTKAIQRDQSWGPKGQAQLSKRLGERTGKGALRFQGAWALKPERFFNSDGIANQAAECYTASLLRLLSRRRGLGFREVGAQRSFFPGVELGG